MPETATMTPDGPEPRPAAPTPGDHPAKIGRFDIRRFLGEGAFGRVYEAYDPSLKRAVALKVAKAEQMAGENRLDKGRTYRVRSLAFSLDGKRVVADDVQGKRLAWDAATGDAAPSDHLTTPVGQREACHGDFFDRIDGDRVLVQRLSAITEPPAYLYDRISSLDFHRTHAAACELQSQWYAASFHLELLHHLAPLDRAVRQRLLAALAKSPDHPASQYVRARVIAFDAARVAASVGRTYLPTPTDAITPLAAPAPPEPTRPARMQYAQP